MAASTNDKLTDTRNSGRPNSATVTAPRSAGGTTLTCNSLTGWPTASKVHFVTYQIDSNSNPIAGTQIDCSGIVSGSSIGSLSVIDGTDAGNAVGDVVEMLPTAAWGQDLSDWGLSQHTRTGAHGAITATSMAATGAVSAGNGLSMTGGTFALTGLWDGWIGVSDSWSYNSADATNATYTITVPSDATLVYQPGDKIKLTQGSVKYFIVTKVAATVLTVYGGTDYTLANAAISSPAISRSKSPFGFPLDPAKWTVTTTSSSDRSRTNTSYGTLTDTATAPIGSWILRFRACVAILTDASSSTRFGLVTLSSDGSTETHPNTTLGAVDKNDTAVATTVGSIPEATDNITVTTATTFTMLGKASGGTINVYGSSGAPTSIRFVCAYL